MAKGRSVSDNEIALIKAMLASGGFQKDRIQAYFTRPTRVLNSVASLTSNRADAGRTSSPPLPRN